MPATVIAERIGWDRSMAVLKERVRLLRPVYRGCRATLTEWMASCSTER